ncbi:uncharacterized protein LOC110460239 isoform X2 [Mizuhopecten yessoensis]|uniref:Uncharacterized protein n=1 Tax=Mizuhopecten yessoensis TaxID=6573 RepID=A0A210Q306_MIZYE|nr:uncharacterized protein LOC110460239 isoform X2 [Mizuhopecten yessoensis]OWF43095.1 hypothetical protein KP79_PYT21608 [Mizuhopecten yessoensis]
MTETGLHSLVKPSSEEQLAVECLCNHLQHLKNHDSHFYENQSFLSETQIFLERLRTVCTPESFDTVQVPGWLPCLQSLIVTVSETLYVVLSSYVCKKAADDVIVIPSRAKDQLKELLLWIRDIQKVVVAMQHGMVDMMEAKESRSAVPVRDSQQLAHRSQHALDMLEGCHVLLATVLEMVERKCTFEVRFFNTASVTVGTISVGRFAWSLWQGEGLEEVIHAGLWSTCMGFTAALFQVPRVRVTDIQTQLVRHQKLRKKIKKMSAGWKKNQDWSYAKFVHIPSPRNGARL